MDRVKALRCRRCKLLGTAVGACAVACVAHADVVLDGTMGPGGPIAGPDFVIPDSVGTTRGSNLFHSFGEFNLDASRAQPLPVPTQSKMF